MDHKKLFSEFNRIVTCEEALSSYFPYKAPLCVSNILGTVEQLESIVKSSFIPRCCATRYGPVSRGQVVYESVSAHTNLVKAIVDRTLSYYYGPYFDETEDHYTYREIMAAIERHDLPENIFGDYGDNGTRPNKELAAIEHVYQREFSRSSPAHETEFEAKVQKLYKEFELKLGFTGQLIYCADKLAAILTALGYDAIGKPPVMANNYAGASKSEKYAMDICQHRDYHISKAGEYYFCRASEIWTMDYFEFRRIYKYDQTGLLTAILIMETLIVNEEWYTWREEKYKTP